MKKIFLILLFVSFLFAKTYKIEFKGNKTFGNDTLFKELGFEKTLFQILTFKKLSPKVEEKLLPGLKEELELFYKQEGFWEANIEIKKSEKEEIATFKIEENSPIVVKRVEITSDFPIKKLIELKTGNRFSVKKFIKSKENIKNTLLKRGFCSFDFNPKAYIYTKKREAYLVFFLDKGDICKIKNIKIFGNRTIKDEVILSHIYLKKGGNFTLERVNESIRRLYALEYFKTVRFDYSKKISNNILLDIYVKEREKRNIYKAGLGYESQSGVHVSFSWKNINIKQNQIELSTFYSEKKKEIDSKLFTPSKRFFSKYFDIVYKINYSDEKYDFFSQKDFKIGISLLKEFYRLSYTISTFYEKNRIYNAQSCYKKSSFYTLYPDFLIVLDRRDSKISPKNGFIVKSSVQGSLKTFSNATYIKNINEVGLYLPYKNFLLFLRGKMGFIDIKSGSLPPGRLFFAGGINSNRAYSYNSIYALKDGCKIGGESILESTVEISHPFYKDIKGAIFWDRTVLGAKKFHFFKKPINGVGIGIRYPSPIGDIKVDFGFDIKKFSQNAIHFSIGATF